MITYTQAFVLGLLQGVTELFPISSLGHSVLFPHVIGWHINENDSQFVAFLVATHVGTALVLLAFFWRDWVRIIAGIFRSFAARRIDTSDTYAKIGWLLVAGTIPAGILGLLFQKQLESLFSDALYVAVALALNGLLLYGAEILRRSTEGAANDTQIAQLSFPRAIAVGTMQALALIPGFSRTGAAMTGALWSGLSHENAARFAFLLATPIIFAAAVLKLPDLFAGGGAIVGPTVIGALAAACAAYVSVRFLLKYFETKTLTPFAIYCVCAGIFALIAIAHPVSGLL
ncbi:MAG TPA: undecaprenyl-diphosphate phosphatase [Candidatus Paceibacterota bacterium]|nr:undecaprenyl-diphosphate phosphatase [Candidatus Paceibacterota bacterium]